MNPLGLSWQDAPGLGLSLINSLLYKQQADEIRDLSNQQYSNVLGGWAAMGNGGQPGLMDASGNYHLMPDVMGALDRYATDISGLMQADSAAQEGAYQQYAAGVEDRMKDLSSGLTIAYGGLADRLLGSYDQGASSLEQGFLDRYNRGLANLKGMGDQERRDINERYDARSGALNQDLISRGIRNSTVAQSMQQGNERERTADLGRLEERLRQQRLDTDAALSGDLLNMQGQNFINRMNLEGGLEQGRFDLKSQLDQNLMNTQNSLHAGLIDMQNANRRDLTNLLAGVGQQRVNITGTAATNMLNAIAGTNFVPPSNDYLAVNASLGSAQQAAKVLDWQQEEARKNREMSWISPLAGAGTAAIGGLAFSPVAGLSAGITKGFSKTAQGWFK